MSFVATPIVTILLPLLMAPGNLVASPQPIPGTIGLDVSYPNCSAVLPHTDFGIVGVTGGRTYTQNPCFLRQAMTFPQPSLYVNTGWNGKSDQVTVVQPKKCVAGDNNCLAYNFGYNAAVAAYDMANHAWVRSSTWWLDVETSNSWSDDVMQNRNSLQGEYDALRARGVATVGAYSTSYQWGKITGNWKNGWPSWGATVVTSAPEAQAFCTDHEFTGGRSRLVQFGPPNIHLDHDVAC
jgi:hypothetical protein